MRQQSESPARRLEILYIASLSAIALLSVVSQAFILRELAWYDATARPVLLSLRHRSLDRSLGLAAMAVQASDDPKVRGERIEAFRNVLDDRKRNPQGIFHLDAGELRDGKEEAAPIVKLERVAPRRTTMLAAADSLLAAWSRHGEASPRTPEIAGLVDRVAANESAYWQSIGQLVLDTDREVSDRIRHLKILEFKLFGLMLAVLLLEGLFVISPAVRKIQHIMAEMEQSQEGLRTYAARLERSNLELQDFASVASHDLQEPLRKVMAFSDRLKIKCGAALDDQGRDYLDRVQNAARRMQTLINDLLTYARVTTKAQPFVSTDLSTATHDVVSDLEVRIEQVKGQVEVGALPTVEADPLQVRQLMQNLIGNALKYHRPEEAPRVKIHARLLNKLRVPEPETNSADLCEILVEDNGIGFDEVYTDRIFTIFQRLHGRSEYEGTGVGLAVCRKIAERHGGTITARSTPGKGSTFMVTLPVRQPKERNANG